METNVIDDNIDDSLEICGTLRAQYTLEYTYYYHEGFLSKTIAKARWPTK